MQLSLQPNALTSMHLPTNEKKANIYYIEDNDELRENTVEILRLEGFNAIGCSCADEFYGLMENEIPDLVLCDIMMPGDDGHAVIANFRANEAWSRIPFIFVTALTSRNEMRKSMDEGADDYLTKPFNVDELLTAINTRLSRAYELAQLESIHLEEFGRHKFGSSLRKVKECLQSIENSRSALHSLPIDAATAEQIRTYLGEILREADVLANLATNTLLYTQVFSPSGQKALGKLKLITQNVDVSQMLTLVGEKTGCFMSSNGDADLYLVNGNESLIKKIVEEVNLYMKSRSGTGEVIKVYGKENAQNGDNLALSFRFDESHYATARHSSAEPTKAPPSQDNMGFEVAAAIAKIIGGSLSLKEDEGPGLEIELEIPRTAA
jgi:two-component system sensor histidine kinase/response regulator